MANLDGRKIAILIDDGFEQVEMTEPRKALVAAGAETRIVSPHRAAPSRIPRCSRGLEPPLDGFAHRRERLGRAEALRREHALREHLAGGRVRCHCGRRSRDRGRDRPRLLAERAARVLRGRVVVEALELTERRPDCLVALRPLAGACELLERVTLEHRDAEEPARAGRPPLEPQQPGAKPMQVELFGSE